MAYSVDTKVTTSRLAALEPYINEVGSLLTSYIYQLQVSGSSTLCVFTALLMAMALPYNTDQHLSHTAGTSMFMM